MLDSEFSKSGNKTIVVFGPKFLSNKLNQASTIEVITYYNLVHILLAEKVACFFFFSYVNKNKDWILQDIELAKTLIRPGSLFIEDLSQQKNFSIQGYGSVPLAFIVSTEDQEIPLNFQHWMIQNAGINVEVLEIKGADHMLMISKPQELCDSLLQIATKYA